MADAFINRQEAESPPTRGVVARRVALAIVILLAALLRLYNLGEQEYGNIYYAAAARSMAADWHNFLYASFDPAGFLSVDKPPVAFWIQALFIRLLGFSGLSILLPQALAGTLSVCVVYLITRKAVGAWGGLLAAAVLAVTPVNVAVDRSNLPDGMLVFVVVLAAWALVKATEASRARWLWISFALLGIGFNTKMLAAFLVLPAFAFVYLFADREAKLRRTLNLGVAGLILVVTSLAWPVLVDLTPPDQRPYVDGTRANSELQLCIGFNGLDRILGMGHGPPSRPQTAVLEHDGPPRPPGARGDGPPPPHLQGGGFTGFSGRPGWARLANRELAGHISWMIPLVILAWTGRFALTRREEGEPGCGPVLWLCTGWFLTCAVVFSFSTGVIHTYYMSLIGPPLACLAGIAAVLMWRGVTQGALHPVWLAVCFALTATWQITIVAGHREWLMPLGTAIAVSTVLAIPGLLPRVTGRGGKVAITSAFFAVIALLAGPVGWSAMPALAPTGNMIPIADPILIADRDRRGPSPADDPFGVARLASFLESNWSGEEFLVAVPEVHLAAPIIITTGSPVMAIGGFHGIPIISKHRLVQMIEAGRIRYVLLGPPPLCRGLPADFVQWVRENGREVEPEEWGGQIHVFSVIRGIFRPRNGWTAVADTIRTLYRSGGLQLYDCAPRDTRDMVPTGRLSRS